MQDIYNNTFKTLGIRCIDEPRSFFMQKNMARPQRNNVDYFPFYCEDGNKMFYLEETYGNDGFAVFLKLLRELARTDYHYLDLSKPSTKMFLSAKCKVSKEVLESIIKDLVELEKFDSELWKDNSIIWCQDFIDSIQDAYSKRSNSCMLSRGFAVRTVEKTRGSFFATFFKCTSGRRESQTSTRNI